jgi:hypothetical protein
MAFARLARRQRAGVACGVQHEAGSARTDEEQQVERSDTSEIDETIEEATSGRSSEHERRVVQERDERSDDERGDWPGEPGDPPGAADTGT